jgi:hypothetical protein
MAVQETWPASGGQAVDAEFLQWLADEYVPIAGAWEY